MRGITEKTLAMLIIMCLYWPSIFFTFHFKNKIIKELTGGNFATEVIKTICLECCFLIYFHLYFVLKKTDIFVPIFVFVIFYFLPNFFLIKIASKKINHPRLKMKLILVFFSFPLFNFLWISFFYYGIKVLNLYTFAKIQWV